MVRWAGGLGAFGPEALVLPTLDPRGLVRAMGRPHRTSRRRLVDDCDDNRLATLLEGQSSSAWQRAAYLLDAAGQPDRGAALFERRPAGATPKVRFSDRAGRSSTGAVWVPRYKLQDQLIAPLQAVLGKA